MGVVLVDAEKDDEDDEVDGEDRDEAEEVFGFEKGVRLEGHSKGDEEMSLPAFRGAATWMVSRSSRGSEQKVRMLFSVQ